MTEKRRVLIYGAAGGIGSALCRILHAQGVQLHLVGRTESKLSALAKEVAATYTVGDVSDAALFNKVAQEAGEPLDGLVYAVGTITIRSLARLSAEDFLHDFRLNALGAALAVQAALPALKKSAGVAAVVLFSSVAVAGLCQSRLDRHGKRGGFGTDPGAGSRVSAESAGKRHCPLIDPHAVGRKSARQ